MASVATGYLLAGRALRPLRAITATARRVSSENLGERIALEGPNDELRELADTFDRMLARLDGAFASQRHFVANASHELRTPLAIMRTEVDVTLSDPDATVDELRAMGEAVRETVDRCEMLIAGLLMLARSEAATGRGEPVDVAALAGDCITDLRARAEEAHVEVHDELEPAWMLGEPALLERMVANLLDNGIHHNEPGGFLVVSTRVRGGRLELRVRNGGARIAPVDAQQLVEPFRRLHRSVDGFGLGALDRAFGGRGARGWCDRDRTRRGWARAIVRPPRARRSAATLASANPARADQKLTLSATLRLPLREVDARRNTLNACRAGVAETEGSEGGT